MVLFMVEDSSIGKLTKLFLKYFTNAKIEYYFFIWNYIREQEEKIQRTILESTYKNS